MRTSSTTVDAYHLQVMVERMQQEGRSEREIVRAVEESDDRPSRRPSTPTGPTSRRWPTRLIRSHRLR